MHGQPLVEVWSQRSPRALKDPAELPELYQQALRHDATRRPAKDHRDPAGIGGCALLVRNVR